MTVDITPEDIALKVRLDQKYGYKPPMDYRNTPIDYIDPAPKPITVQVPLVEMFERVKRFRADRWQVDFCNRLQASVENKHIAGTWAEYHAEAQLGKTTILSQVFPAWCLGHDPLFRYVLAMYNISRAENHSEVVIQIMNSPIYKAMFPNKECHLPKTVSKAGWMTNARLDTENGAADGQKSFNPVGLQSGVTGSGFEYLVIDDPYKEAKDAFSSTVADNLARFWEYTVKPRLMPYSCIAAMFHRYSPDDFGGFLLDTGKFDYVRYATVADGDYIHESTGQKFSDPLGRQMGEYLSERRPASFYDGKRENKQVWLSMYQGRPSSEEGEFFNVGRFQSPTITKEECSVLVRAWDIAATQDGGDYSVGALIGMTPDKRVRLFDVQREQVDAAGRDKLQRRTAEMDGPNVIVAIPQDPGAAGKTQVFHIEQNLQGFQVTTRPTTGSKEDRARSLASAVNSGHFEIDEEIGHFKAIRREFRDFPLSDHDDIVDAVVDGYNECFTRVARGQVIKGFGLQHLLPIQRFDETFGTLIPKAWTVYVGMKITPEANAPNSAVIVARASESSEMNEVLFVAAEYKEYTDNFYVLFDWLNDSLDALCEDAQGATIYLHPSSADYVPTIIQKVKCPVQLFDKDKLAGLTEANWYLLDGEEHKLGNARMYGLVADDQLAVAKDSFGLYHLRQEAATWGYNDKQEPNAVGHVWDCLRMVTHNFRTKYRRLTLVEQHEKMMSEKGLGYEAIERLTGQDQIALAQARAIADRAFMKKQKESKQAVNPFRRRA